MAETITLWVTQGERAGLVYRLFDPTAARDLRPYWTQEATLTGLVLAPSLAEGGVQLEDGDHYPYTVEEAIAQGKLILGAVVERWNKATHG